MEEEEIDDNFLTVLDLIPEGALVLHSFRMVEYLDEEGTPQIVHLTEGEWTDSELVGCLEIAKQEYIWGVIHGEEEE